MRHRRWPRPAPFEDTIRKCAAFLCNQRIEREALALADIEVRGECSSADLALIGRLAEAANMRALPPFAVRKRKKSG
jgi:hypothetical protein